MCIYGNLADKPIYLYKVCSIGVPSVCPPVLNSSEFSQLAMIFLFILLYVLLRTPTVGPLSPFSTATGNVAHPASFAGFGGRAVHSIAAPG